MSNATQASRANELAYLRTDTVGSLVRPEALRRAKEDYLQGTVAETALSAVEDDAIVGVLASQEAHGLAVVSDGEFRRMHYMDSFSDVSGVISPREQMAARRAAMSQPDSSGSRGGDPALANRMAVTEPLRLVHNRPLAEYEFVTRHSARPATVTVTGPDRVLQGLDVQRSSDVYGNADELADGVVSTLTQIVGQLSDAGCRYVHLDESGFTSYVDDVTLDAIRARGEDPDAMLDRSIQASNQVVDAFPDIVFGVHVCRGNRKSRWHREGSYDAIAERLFGALRCQRLLLEYDTDAAGGFEPLRFVQPGAVAVLGLISTGTPELESADSLLRRLDDAARYLPMEQLAISPQCGFAPAMAGAMTEDDQWRKLDLMLEVADRAWG